MAHQEEFDAGDVEIDSIALWLLRIGIDHSGRLVLNRLWDIAIRAAVLADLTLSGAITETDTEIQIDSSPRTRAYETTASRQLIDAAGTTQAHWVCAGRFRASDVAAELIRSGEWTRPPILTASLERPYRAEKLAYVALRRRIAHVYDGELAALSDAEAAIAVLGHALNVVRPNRILRDHPSRARPLDDGGCGEVQSVIDTAITEISARVATNGLNPNPTW